MILRRGSAAIERLISADVLIVGLAVLVGAWIRLNYLTQSDFPLNDGGLFYSMANDLIRNGFALPKYTSYNQMQIPFAYPFFPIYVIAGLQAWLGIDLLDTLHYLPFLVNLATIPVIFSLMKKLTKSTEIAGFAILTYVLIRPGYEWFIFGGGITRSMGWLFAMLALNIYYDSTVNFQKRHYFYLPVCMALTFASHLEIGWFTSFSIAVYFVFLSRRFHGAIFLSIAAVLAFILLSPYWLSVMNLHGADVFLNALHSGEYKLDIPIVKLLYFNFTHEGLLNIFAVLSLLGLMWNLINRKYFLPAWLAAIVFLDPRSVDRSVAIVICVLAGYGLYSVVMVGFQRLVSPTDEGRSKGSVRLKSILVSGFIFYLFIGTVIQGFLSMPQMKGLSMGNRMAMEEIARITPKDSRFLVLSSSTSWSIDMVGEWFPALADRKSVLTVQGSEWLGDGNYYAKIEQFDEIKSCIGKNKGCFIDWADENQKEFDFIYLTNEAIDKNKIDFSRLPGASRKIFENSDVVVLKVN